MTLVIPKNGCNYIEIYIGQSKLNRFCCDITEEQFINWKKKCSIYNNKKIKTQKLFYKNLIMETIYSSNYYKQQLISNNIDNNKLVLYYKNSSIRSSEFPNKHHYSYEEKHDTYHFIIDKNINIYFRVDPYRNIKVTANIFNLNRQKLNSILQLFT